MIWTLIMFLGLTLLSLGCGPSEVTEPPVEEAQAEEQSEPSLYDRLGGVYPIASVVDAFIEKVLVNEILNANPAINEARSRVPKPGLKFHLTAMVCQASGGAEQYTGRSMKETHQNMNITEKEWEALLADFKETLDEFQIPETEQSELFAIVESTKGDIVMSSSM
ncbi:group 1 truncated hemoglobin [Acidobacteria bacterium AH-259-D05]|nr:group 1 truncated hemoglobin [Acidobacteria bacterium AH-259-D05]